MQDDSKYTFALMTDKADSFVVLAELYCCPFFSMPERKFRKSYCCHPGTGVRNCVRTGCFR